MEETKRPSFAMEEDDSSFGLCKHDSELLKCFNSTLKDLRGLVISNIEFFQRGRSALHARYYASSCILLERTQILEPLVSEFIPQLRKFDFSDEVPGNGYRSFISLLNRCCVYLLQLCRHIHTSKSSLFFQSSRYCKDLESYVETLGQLIASLHYLKQLMSYCSDGELFLKDDSVVGDSLLLQVEMINTDCFYGRCLGFQFCESIQKALQAVLVVMATFSECYDEPSQVMQLASSLLNSGKYVIDQELRARQVVNITRTGDLKFCKAFWSIPESPILSHLRSFTFAHVEVSDIISLEPVNFELPSTTSEETVTITPPCAYTGPAPVKVRLISHVLREGQDTRRRRFKPKTGSAKPDILPQSAGLLFHCHGGGFVAQSSQSHESYLRTWARELEVPILSVDYSLAPDYPFPRALEECFYAYAWALKNPSKLGWTGERVCFAGDSAGANLVLSTAVRAVSFEIRVPDGIMSAYAPVLIQYTPSPARFMSMIDPLLPVGILMRCLAAYAGIADEFSSALAKPIFCNPGTVEPWEVVDSTKTEHIDNYIGDLPPSPIPEGSGAWLSDSVHQIDTSMYDTQNGCFIISDGKTDLKNQNQETSDVTGALADVVDTVSPVKDSEVKTEHEISSNTNRNIESSDDDFGDIIFVDSQMIPIVNEPVQSPPKSFSSSKLFSYIKKDKVRSFMSGVKSLITRPNKNTDTNLVEEETPKVGGVAKVCNNSEHEMNVNDSSPIKSKETNIKLLDDDGMKTDEHKLVLDKAVADVNMAESVLKDSSIKISKSNDSLEVNSDSKKVTLSNTIEELNNCKSLNENEEEQKKHDSISNDAMATQELNPNDHEIIVETVVKATAEDNDDESSYLENKYNSTKLEVRSDKFSQLAENETLKESNEESCINRNKSMETEKAQIKDCNNDLQQTSKRLKLEPDKLESNWNEELSDSEMESAAEDMESFAESMKNCTEYEENVIEDLSDIETKLCDTVSKNQVCGDACESERTETTDVGHESQRKDSVEVQAVDASESITTLVGSSTENSDHKDPCELYAVCQELLDEASSHGHEYETSGYHDPIIGSSSCHTLEDRSSFFFYGDNRRLSIHSEGSCNSIEDSYAWMAGEDIDIVEVNTSDIVTVIADNDQNNIQEQNSETGAVEVGLKEKPTFYIDNASKITEGFDNLEIQNINSESKETTACIDSAPVSETVENEIETVNSRQSLDMNNTKIVTDVGHLSENIKTVENMACSEMIYDRDQALKPGNSETVNEVVVAHMSTSVSSDSGFHCDTDGLMKSHIKDNNDKPRSLSSPVDNVSKDNKSDTEESDHTSKIKQGRRTMSLDLTHNHNSISEKLNTDLLLPKSSTIPRSSTVPELLSGSVTPKLFSVQRNIAQSPIQLFRKLPIVKNPYMSPILASDDMLLGLPNVHLVACHFDPLLDDSVMFARKLRSLGKYVDLHIVDNLPHGFLNFADASPEAKHASKYCLNKIKEVLKIDIESP